MPSYPKIQDADGRSKFLRNIANHQYCTAMYPSISDQPATFAFKVEYVENECLTQRLATTYETDYTASQTPDATTLKQDTHTKAAGSSQTPVTAYITRGHNPEGHNLNRYKYFVQQTSVTSAHWLFVVYNGIILLGCQRYATPFHYHFKTYTDISCNLLIKLKESSWVLRSNRIWRCVDESLFPGVSKEHSYFIC
jgi:hypothetical protein